MTIVCADNTPIMLQWRKENAAAAFSRADVQIFLTAKSAPAYAENNGCDVLLCELEELRNLRYR